MSAAIICLFLAITVNLSIGYPTGAPIQVCESMKPEHGKEAPQTGISPYRVLASKKLLNTKEKIQLTLEGPVSFQGYLLEIRDENGIANGKFILPSDNSDIQTLDCFQNVDSAITHKTPKDKTSITVEWIAPNQPGRYTILATIVQNIDKFWVKQSMGTLQIN